MPANTSSTAAQAATIVAASLGFALVPLDVTVLNVALQRIATTLAAGTAALQWVVDGYTPSFALLLLSAGALRRRHAADRQRTSG